MDLAHELHNIRIDRWENAIFRDKEVWVDVLRLDRIHPHVSGNKWFKLKYYLERAKQGGKQRLVSFGGPYSNHLVALAEACRLYGFAAKGFVRGEKPAQLSHTLLAAQQRGMDLHFLSRADYQEKKKSTYISTDASLEADDLVIPEGGASEEGVRGASEILQTVSNLHVYSHISCAVGTGTTLAGLVTGAGSNQQIIGVSVLKGTNQLQPLPDSWFPQIPRLNQVQMIHNNHFGGYAKAEASLFDFMNRIFLESGIPTDFVYTGKLFHALAKRAAENGFPCGSRLLVVHTGGLQGNASLKPGLLIY